jgi:WD40 repeat protein/class 3 adenylate cyclase
MPAEGATGGGQGAADAHIRTFLIADVRGYTLFTQERGDEAAAKLAAKFADLAREGVEARGGSVVELRGDEALAVFDSARQAIRASVELQRRFVDETVADPTLPLAVGIGLDAGEAVPVGDGFRGGALNLAARLCGIAGPAEILASPAVTHLARKVDGVAYVDRGEVHLKGLAEPVQVIRLRSEADDAADDIAFRRSLGSAAVRIAPAVPGAIAPNPYKGLRAFEESDAVDFFGREELVRQLVDRIADTRFLAVVGPSGSGKSSVVRAGLIPALRRGAVAGSDTWGIADMFPGTNPLDGLEAALLRAAPEPPASLMDQLERDEHGLLRAVLRSLPSDGSELLVVIDQFEEVFTLVEDEAVRAHFLGSLEAAATDPHSRLRVVVTLRADFYDRPLLYRGFAELFKSRVEAVVPLSPGELEQAISGPARRVDVSLEPALTAAMLTDVAEEPGALPLMEYALTELFDRRDGRVLALQTYRELGGVSGALGRRAEELFDEHDADGKEAARQLFLRLVALGEGTEDTRRRVARSEIASLDVDQGAMAAVLDAFGASRLLSFDRDPRTGAPTIELAHEAILSAWPRLHRWIVAAREDLRIERRLGAAAGEWVDAGRDPSFLLQGSRLEQAASWTSGSGIAATPEERDYVKASEVERDRRTADEEAREAHERDLERRSVRRLRAVVGVLAVASVVAAGLTVFATTQRGQAQKERRIAVARELAAASLANLDVDAERSVLLALEAVDATRSVDGSVIREAEEALHRAVIASRIELSIPGLGGALDWSSRGVFVTEGPEDTGTIDIRDARTGDPAVPPFHGNDVDINDVAFSADGSMLATVGDDGALKIWDPETGGAISTSRVANESVVLGPSFSADGSLASATWPFEGMVRIIDTSSGRVVRAIEGIDVGASDTALSPDGDRIVMAYAQIPEAGVYDVRSGRLLFRLRGHNGSINTLSWSPDGRLIATGGGEAAVRIWNADTGALVTQLLGHTGGLVNVDWAPDSHRLLTTASDGIAKIWAIEDAGGRELLSLPAQEQRSATWGAFSPDGTEILTGDIGITAVKIWDVSATGGAEVQNFPTDRAPVDVAFLPDGNVVAPIGAGSVAIWDVDSGRRLRTIGPGSGTTEAVVDIAVNADGSRMAMKREFANTVGVWDLRTGQPRGDLDRPGEVSSVTWDRDDRLFVSSYDGTMAVFDPRGEHSSTFDEAEGFFIEDSDVSPDGRLVASAVNHGRSPILSQVSIRAAATGSLEHLFPAREGAGTVAFDPSAGSILAVGRFSGAIEIWDARHGKLLRRIRARVPIGDLAYRSDGRWIATGNEDGTARIFDATTGEQVLALPGHDLVVTGIAFSPDGSMLATAAVDGLVRVWALDLDDLIDIAKTKVTRELSDDECRRYLHESEGCQAA